MLKHLLIFLWFGALLLAQPLSFTTKVLPKAEQALIHAKPKSEIFVNINPKALQKNRSILIDLPDDLTATFTNDKFIFRKDGDFAWSGKATDGNVTDTILLTTKSGATYGVIIRNKVRYVVQKNSDGTYKIFKEPKIDKDTNDFIRLPPKKSLELYPSGINEAYVVPLVSEEPVVEDATDLTVSALETDSTVNVMILYTQLYADYYGSGLDAKIQYSVDYANVAMANSLVSLTFNLGYQALYENSLSNEATGISAALTHIHDSDEIKQLRAAYSTDMTSLFHLDLDGGTVGLGYIPNDSSRSSMRSASYNVSSFSDDVYAHESGHNFGCGHDYSLGCSGIFSYACGFDSSGIGTIMSYNSNNIQYFSNPNIFIDPVYIGVAEGGVNPADCSRTIDETRVTMAMNDDITEVNEAGDSLTGDSSSGYVISGSIGILGDRDSYLVSLGADTTIEMSSQYSNIAFYVNLYTENGYLVRSFITASEIVTVDNGRYILVISTKDDVTGTYYDTTLNYTVNLTSNYVERNGITAVINYLLD